MLQIVHPLAEELGNLVEDEDPGRRGANEEKDSSWMWMIGIVVVIGLFAWITR